jgi:hypothetical protein
MQEKKLLTIKHELFPLTLAEMLPRCRIEHAESLAKLITFAPVPRTGMLYRFRQWKEVEPGQMSIAPENAQLYGPAVSPEEEPSMEEISFIR